LGEAFRTEFVVAGLVIPLLSIWRHRTNIVRLLKGEENRLKLFTKGMKIKQ
jgi:glycerol-3-phosphate acyltransferase PlsY